jgi:hypothetical protein
MFTCFDIAKNLCKSTVYSSEQRIILKKKKMRENCKPKFSTEYLRSIVDYDPETGIFRRKDISRKIRRSKNMPIGTLKKGYLYIGINEQQYMAHRLAWMYVTGEWPTVDPCHANGHLCDNSFENLKI